MNKYLLIIFSVTVLFTACYNTNSLEEEKSICLKQNKNFYISEVYDSNNAQTKLKVVCK